MKENRTELVFVLDKSGSMYSLKQDTIGGYNSMLDKQRALPGQCMISTLLFDHGLYWMDRNQDIRQVKNMSEETYQPSGCTALLDAMGTAIDTIKKDIKSRPKSERPDKVLFVIITDGMENASKHYPLNKVRSKIEKMTQKHGWEFIFLGANIDAVSVASDLGIAKERAAEYMPSAMGTAVNFDAITQTVTSFRQCGSIEDTSLDMVREFTAENKGKASK